MKERITVHAIDLNAKIYSVQLFRKDQGILEFHEEFGQCLRQADRASITISAGSFVSRRRAISSPEGMGVVDIYTSIQTYSCRTRCLRRSHCWKPLVTAGPGPKASEAAPQCRLFYRFSTARSGLVLEGALRSPSANRVSEATSPSELKKPHPSRFSSFVQKCLIRRTGMGPTNWDSS